MCFYILGSPIYRKQPLPTIKLKAAVIEYEDFEKPHAEVM